MWLARCGICSEEAHSHPPLSLASLVSMLKPSSPHGEVVELLLPNYYSACPLWSLVVADYQGTAERAATQGRVRHLQAHPRPAT